MPDEARHRKKALTLRSMWESMLLNSPGDGALSWVHDLAGPSRLFRVF